MSNRINMAADLNNLDKNTLLSKLRSASASFKKIENEVTRIADGREAAANKTAGVMSSLGVKLFIVAAILALLVYGFSNFTNVIYLMENADEGLARLVAGGTLLFFFVGIPVLFIIGAKIIGVGSKGRKAQKDEAQEIARLNKLEKQMIIDFEADFKRGTGFAYTVIPEEYRLSVIMDRFCKYLTNGKANGWKECMRVFQHDENLAAEQRYREEMISNLKAIRFNTAMTAIFSASSAVSLARINSKL